MHALVPYLFEDLTVTSYSLTENEHPQIVQGQAYTAGARVILNHFIYEALTSSISSWTDPLDPTQWLLVGPTNYFGMFDQAVGTYSTAWQAINLTVSVPGPMDDIVFFGAVGTSITITTSGGSRTQTIPASVNDAGSTVIFFKLGHLGGPVQVSVNGTGTVKVGSVLFGTFSYLGDTEWGTKLGMMDYSIKSFDAFGSPKLVQRDFDYTLKAPFSVPTSDVDRVVRVFTAIRSTPVAWLGVTDIETSVVYGIYNDFSIRVGGVKSTGTVGIQSLSMSGTGG